MMKRPDWRDHLHTYLERCEDRAFDWFSHSCLTFVTGAVTAMTGVDYWREERERLAQMENRGDVLRYMTRYGGSLVGATGLALRPVQPQPRKIPGEGDIIIATVDKTDTAGICLGRLSVFVGADGLLYWKPAHIVAAWDVG